MELKVELQAGGSRTLMQRHTGDHRWKQAGEPGLVGNPDTTAFYRCTAAYVASLSAKGVHVHYSDAAK